MNSQLTENVKFLQKAALIHEGKVLILKRSEDSDSRPGAWDLPGGNVEWPSATEPMANPHQAEVVREIQEETGLSFDLGLFTDEALVFFFTFIEPEIQRYSLICGWRVNLADDFDQGSIKLSDEHTEWAWISLDELEAYDFGEPVGTYIKNIIRRACQRK